jgi:hypothetical protein
MRPCVSLICATGAIISAQANEAVTYAKDIAPLLNEHCVRCHRPGEVAPMSLRTYAEVRPWAKSIQKRVVQEKSMPPWHADPAHGVFKNDARLSDVELAKLDGWINSGTPLGNESDLPQAREFPDGWVLGEPDYIVPMSPVEIAADGPDRFENVAVKMDLPEDKWIRAIEIQPSQKRAVHHIFAYVSDDGKQVGGKIGAYSAGGGPTVFPEGSGRLVKKDQQVMATIHYHPFGTAATDQTRIGLYFANKDITQESVALSVVNSTFKIPAGAKDYEVKASHTFEQDCLITTLGPHMHQRGKDMSITAVYPDGREELLLISRWNPDWNIKYELAEPLVAPKGTRLDLVAHFDNSADNPNNPDPTKDLTFGVDEMMIGFIDYLVELEK